jgi:hypothetical protein
MLNVKNTKPPTRSPNGQQPDYEWGSTPAVPPPGKRYTAAELSYMEQMQKQRPQQSSNVFRSAFHEDIYNIVNSSEWDSMKSLAHQLIVREKGKAGSTLLYSITAGILEYSLNAFFVAAESVANSGEFE